MKTHSLLLILLIGLFQPLKSANSDTTVQQVPIVHWLVAGPATIKKPFLATPKNVKGKELTNADLLKFTTKKVLEPEKGELFLETEQSQIIWEDQNPFKGFKTNDTLHLQKSWLATYLYTDRFMEVGFKIKSRQCFEFFVDGAKKASLYHPVDTTKKASVKECRIKLERGKHLLVIKSLYNPSKEGNWEIETALSFSKKIPKSAVKIETTRQRYMDIHHLLDGTHLIDMSVSYNGDYYMKYFKKVYPPDGQSERWFEIYEHDSQRKIYSSEYAQVHQVQWLPNQNAISFVTKDEGKEKLLMLNIKTFEKSILLEDTDHMSDYEWASNGEFVIYTLTEEPEKEKNGVVRIINPMDRWPWWRKRGQLYKLNVKDKRIEQLTFGFLTNHLQSISPDGKKILFSQNLPNFKERPYTKQLMLELNLEKMEVDTIWEERFSGEAQYGPKGNRLLVLGSASMFHGAGINIPKKMIPNDYDTQAYLFDIQSKTVTPLSKHFAPSIQSGKWLKNKQAIIFKVEEKSWNKLYLYTIDKQLFQDLKAEVDMVYGFDIPEKSESYLTYFGSRLQYPTTGWFCTLNGTQHTLVADPEKDFFKNILFGKTENWNFKNKKGKTIEGRVYYPPDFDSTKKYPVIVYYYGGTSPTGRDFRGRYPKNLFAAQGYIVYVLQPSGATGFGQEFSALHVNDWGKTVADEIIFGTKTFLKEHPCADAGKVGCIGASYGGFMTMLLTTKTDLFAAAIEHAGISSISSYWGEGYWGYLYSSVASANSFPWNNRKLYVGQSPLFNADKVNTPLLLLHGKADTNVPVGESIQMFTALKLLGKPVELIEIEGQDHHITDYKKRILWQKTILAWFDKWLKDQKDWWDYLYPEENL